MIDIVSLWFPKAGKEAWGACALLPDGLPILSSKPSQTQIDSLTADMAKAKVLTIIQKDPWGDSLVRYLLIPISPLSCLPRVIQLLTFLPLLPRRCLPPSLPLPSCLSGPWPSVAGPPHAGTPRCR